MKAAFLSGKGFEIRDVPTPSCGAGEVLVRSAACGVCEGDLFRYKTVLKEGAPDGGILLGHEGGGIVCEVGQEVKGFKPGDRVADLGKGSYSEYFASVPESLAKIPGGLPFEEALGEPVACYVHAAGRFGIAKGGKVAVLGCGFMGLGCLQMALLQGAGELIAFDPIEWRRAKAAELGASKTLDPASYGDASSLASLGEFDVVIEAAGTPEAVEMATSMVCEHGRIVLVGYHQSNGGRRNIDMKTWNYKALDIVNGHVRRDGEKHEAMKEGLKLIANGSLDMKSIVSVYRFEDIQAAFEDLASRKAGLFKAALKFSL